MPPTRRRNRKPRADSPARLPIELRSFDAWMYPDGMRDYLAALSNLVGDERAVRVMNAAGLTVADWFHRMMIHPPTDDTTDRPNVALR